MPADKPTICKRCGKTWAGHDGYCPESPLRFTDHDGKLIKWEECACFTHTCYRRTT